MKKLFLQLFEDLRKEIIKGIPSRAVGTNSKGQITKYFDVYCEKKIIAGLKRFIKFRAEIVSEELKCHILINPGAKTPLHYIVIDPVDGSDNYLNAISFVCVAIAVFDENYEPVLSFAGNYFSGEYFYADTHTAVYNGRKIVKPARIRRSILLTLSGSRFVKGDNLLPFVKKFYSVRSLGSTVGEVMQVIAGRFGSFVDVRGKLTLENFAPFFLAAKYGLIEMTDEKGQPIKILSGLALDKGYDIIISGSKKLHNEILEDINRML
jgi:fructose-1,6-bisphosphatase/inositol monophosphatase family enzyme